MQKALWPRPDDARLNLTPLIDMVFLLLTYFLTTATLYVAEGVLPSDLPRPGAPPPPADPRQEDLGLVRIRLIAGPDGLHIRLNEAACASLADLRTRLQQVARLGQPPVIIDADREVKFGGVVAVYDTCKVVGLKRIAFAAPASGAGG